MKKECEIVQDLLFGYQDKTLKQGSKELVEEHLKKCQECQNVWKEMQEEKMEEKGEQEREIDYLKKVKKKVRKKNKLLTIGGILLALIIIFNVAIFIRYSKEERKVQVYLNDDVTAEQLEKIEETVMQVDEKAKIQLVSKAETLEEMKERFKENVNLLNGYGETNNPFPAYYKIEMESNKIQILEEKMLPMPGVKKINSRVEMNPYSMFISEVMVRVTSK